MNIREIGELRRRTRRDRSNITTIYGCYVSGQKQIISTFSQSAAMMPENEAEKYFGVFRRTLSGAVGKNLIDIAFRTEQVVSSEEHKFLMELRSSKLADEQLRMSLFQKIIDGTAFPDSFLILAACDSYDVPFRSRDGQQQAENSSEVFQYIHVAVCPVKQAKAPLHYVAENREFHDGGLKQVAAAPELGFIFPAFDDRSTNIYGALFYTHSAKQNNQPLIDALFHVQAPQPAQEQKESFETLLAASLKEACSMEVMQSVHEELRQCIALHKESKVPEPLLISKEHVVDALTQCGVPQKQVSKFKVDFDQVFGLDAQLHPNNIINDKRFDITTPDVSIKVNPERTDLIETRVIGGVKYILICADENVEVNGVRIHIDNVEE